MKIYRAVAHRGSSDELAGSILGASPNNCPQYRRYPNPNLQNLTHTTPVFCPVDAIGAQLDDGGVDRMDLALELMQRALVAYAMGKGRGLPGEQCIDFPEQGTDEIRIPVLVGMGQSVFPRGMDAEALERARLQLEPVAQVGETDDTG